MRFSLRVLFTVLLLGSGLTAQDQTGAETKKKPVSAEIVSGRSKSDDVTFGNVRVTYADKTKDFWTTKGNCQHARVAKDGTVGWTVVGPLTNIAASYQMRPNGRLVLYRQGKVIAEITSGKGFIEDWDFAADSRTLVLLTRGAHGPADIERYDVATGKRTGRVEAFAKNLPSWAQPYAEN